MTVRSLSPSLVALLAVLAVPLPTSCQAPPARPPLSADRPGLGDKASVLAAGVWQAEVGSTIQAEINDEFLVGSSLVRTGFAGVEMRLFLPSVLVRNQDQLLQLGDLGLGVKVPLDLGGSWWSWAATGTLTLPTGSEHVTADDPGADAAFIGQVELAGDVTVAMNAGYGFLFGDFGGGAASLVVTPTFPFPGGGGLRAYAGYAARIRSGDDDQVIEWGLTRMEGADRQWDLNAGYDPGSHAWFLGIGVAQRR
ncbi:MAG: transporter [Longimicrobiales bacterium]|nr:transporter [Longimicrobiales bacterium]